MRTNSNRFVALSAGLLFGAAILTAPATSFPFFFNAFQNMYPNSMTGDNVDISAGSCVLCHALPSAGEPWNGYGWRLRERIIAGSDINTALAEIELLDGDLDPAAAINIDEIAASTQPGWTPGLNNTFYFADGSTTSGHKPPLGIVGDLNPDLGPSYCSSTQNSSGGAAEISASGSVSADDQDLTLTTAPVPDGVFGIHFFGPDQNSQPFGNGTRCVGGNLQRLPVDQASGDTLETVVDFSSTQAAGIVGGMTLYFQGWFRDPMDAFGFQLSNGLEITFL